jgi:2-polyprenyl-3-methyl-5-hydroxy-6-metoxy-1,4-benzoquinol methylase
MPFFLSNRQPELIEYMDRPACNPELLENTYRQFITINRLLSKWRRIYKTEMRPLMSGNKTYTLLDIGFGGGDVAVSLAKWAMQDRIKLNITAIDTDSRALEFVQKHYPEGLITWRHTSSANLVLKRERYDFVISNHLLHHLKDNQLSNLLKEARELAIHKVLFNDIERNDIGYALFNIFSRVLFRHSFITDDGLTSIKRSFTRQELDQITPSGWNVQTIFPFRLLLTYDKT